MRNDHLDRALVAAVMALDDTYLGVIVSSGYGYLREDGVAVLPIAALGP